MSIDLPNWAKHNHTNERSRRLYPFAPSGQTTNQTVSYTYPKDYGSKPPNSAGWVGDSSLAGMTDTAYGVILFPNLPLYMLSDADVSLLLRWFPGGWNETKLRGVLLTEFNRNAAELPSLDWPNILAMLGSRNPPQDPVELAKQQVFQKMADEEESLPAATTSAELAGQIQKVADDLANRVQTVRPAPWRVGMCIKRARDTDCFNSPPWTELKIELNGMTDLPAIVAKAQGWFIKQSLLVDEPLDQPATLSHLANAFKDSLRPAARRGRLNRDDSNAKRTAMLVLLRQHPTIKDDLPLLASKVGASESTIRRWLAEEEQKFRESQSGGR